MFTLPRCAVLIAAVLLLALMPCAGVAQSAAPPATAATPPQPRPDSSCAARGVSWQYGELIDVGFADGTAMGPKWFSPDTAVVPVLDSVAKDPNSSKRGGGTLLQLLNVLGAAGWEVIHMAPRPGAPFLLKRRTPARSACI